MKLTGLVTLLTVAPWLIACSNGQTAANTGATPAPQAAAAPASATPAPAPAVAKASDESLTIAFDTGSARLSPTAQAQLDGAARLYRDAKPEVMIVAGHTDKTGAEFDNLMLSAKRAELVKRGLVDRGVPAERLQVIAVGEAEPVPNVPPSRAAIVTWR